ncbi:DUF6940 family protein [Fodinibius salsisoli]|uniref:Uncharacterized protein n=1 Tax=Fodinibius salsisoli TaxID=2820877 RepID=A0ABT3PKL1_9BACT|nr:hypothetical protein [Fodinibius salsisoli]MCW9706437.1 hypothetical protein [Fodinibius salsisoli]
MMWKPIEIASNDHFQSFGIQEDGEKINNRLFLYLLRDSSAFRNFYSQLLVDCDFEAFLWENKPMAEGNMDQPYECTLVHNSYLSRCSPDQHTFRQYFDPDRQAVSFPNLGGDAQLIAPCPHQSPECYTHIGSFVRNAEPEQQDALWCIAAEEMLNAIGKSPRWLSTNGLGVSWLHLRIDRRPKYYQTQEYRSFSSE